MQGKGWEKWNKLRIEGGRNIAKGQGSFAVKGRKE